MSFEDKYKLSVHAVIANQNNEILMLKANYADRDWGLPGGSPEPGETIHEALVRECFEELNLKVKILYLSGVYYHHEFNSHTFIFRCEIFDLKNIKLSSEHLEYRYFKIEQLKPMQRKRILDCINFNGTVKSAAFKNNNNEKL